MPSLYPPQGDGYFAGWPFLAMLADKNRALIKVDGQVRVDGPVKSYESTPAQSTPGENRVSATFGKKFSGRILRLERGFRSLPAGFAEQAGPLELALQWPESPSAGRSERLLATGGEGAGDTLLVDYLDPTHARLRFQGHRGAPLPASRSPLRAEAGPCSRSPGAGSSRTRPGAAPRRTPGAGNSRRWRPGRTGFRFWRGRGSFPWRARRPSGWRGPGAGEEFSGVIESVRRLPGP